jgi:16S rRNA processing protein RimM
MARDLVPVILGRLNGLYGTRGSIKVFSWTEPREAICGYPVWLVRHRERWQAYRLMSGRRHGRTVVAQLQGIDDRTAAARLLGAEIGVARDALPQPAPGEFYWVDLVDLEVVTEQGIRLGRVERLFATGANDVLVVVGDRERWLPFVHDDVIRSVDIGGGVIEVDWDPDF